MNAARIPGHEFQPTPDRLREIEDRARRVRELDAREARLLETIARMGSWQVHSPHYGLVTWSFGPGGLSVAYNVDELDE
ncbi:MAG: hypothetical protein KBA15_09035 [Spirochaetes bacterium]|nr:hypothetical protein [Spirochaetota bacterium]